MTDTTEPGKRRGHSQATRRRFLQATAGGLSVGAVTLAGCSSNGDGSGGTGASGEGCPSLTEVTSEYDRASEDSRVFFNEQRSTHEVYVPGDPVALQIGVEPLTPPGETSCPDAANATIDRIVETVRSVE